jgi:hypothetical protein
VEDETAVVPIYFYDRTTLVKSDVTFEYPPFGAPHFMNWSFFYRIHLPLVMRNR